MRRPDVSKRELQEWQGWMLTIQSRIMAAHMADEFEDLPEPARSMAETAERLESLLVDFARVVHPPKARECPACFMGNTRERKHEIRDQTAIMIRFMVCLDCGKEFTQTFEFTDEIPF